MEASHRGSKIHDHLSLCPQLLASFVAALRCVLPRRVVTVGMAVGVVRAIVPRCSGRSFRGRVRAFAARVAVSTVCRVA